MRGKIISITRDKFGDRLSYSSSLDTSLRIRQAVLCFGYFRVPRMSHPSHPALKENTSRLFIHPYWYWNMWVSFQNDEFMFSEYRILAYYYYCKSKFWHFLKFLWKKRKKILLFCQNVVWSYFVIKTLPLFIVWRRLVTLFTFLMAGNYVLFVYY